MQGYGSTTRIQIALSFNTYVTLETETDKERKKRKKTVHALAFSRTTMVNRETGIGVGSYCEHLHRGMHLDIAVSWDLRARWRP